MSGESALHVRLVEALIAAVTRLNPEGRNLVVLADHHSFGRDRPDRIGEFTPDLFARDVPETFRIVGEAKTETDLDTRRSRRQLEAFLDHLALFPGATLVVAVPWLAAARAQSILREIRRPEHTAVKVELIRCA